MTIKQNPYRIAEFPKKTRQLALISLLAFTAPATGNVVVFGSDNAGYGGFTEGATAIFPTPAPAWELTATGAKFTNGPTTDSGQVNSSLLKEYALDRTDGSSYLITGVFEWSSTYAADNNRAGISLFATSGGLSGIDSGLSLQLNIGAANSQNIRLPGVNGGTTHNATPPLSPVTNANFIGQTLTFEALLTFSGPDIIVAFTVRAPGLFTGPENNIPYAQTISHTVSAASYPGNFLGFGTRGRVRNTTPGVNNFPFIYEVRSFSVVDLSVPPTLAIMPNATTAGNYDFVWTGKNGKVYDLVSSPDLSTTINTWPVWNGRAGMPATAPENLLPDVPGGGDARRFFALVERDEPPVFSENFDAAAALPAGWTRNGPVNGTAWEVGVPSGVPTGPATAFTEPNCAGTNIGGYYTENTDVSLLTPAIAIPLGRSATLQFRQLIDTDGAGDIGAVRVLDADNADAPIAGLALPSIQGIGGAWTENTLVMPESDVAGKNIRIEFNFVSNAGAAENSDVYSGFYVDDVSVILD